MKIMFISHRVHDNVCSRIHYNALKRINNNDVLFVDLAPEMNYSNNDDYVCFGSFSLIEKMSWVFKKTTWYLSSKRINEICDLITSRNVKVIFIDDSCLGILAKTIKKRYPDVRIITFYHDVVTYLYNQSVFNNGLKFKLIMREAGILGEMNAQKYSDVNLLLNQRDAKLYYKYYGKNPEGILPMGVEEPDLENKEAAEFIFNHDIKMKYILFVGAYYQPNLDGLRWYVDNVFKWINQDYKLVVIGRGLEKIAFEYENINNIYIIGGVKELAPYYNNADIVIAPIFSGGGMKQKTAEAFAYGRTFIGTKESLQGYEDEIGLQDSGKTIVFSCDTAKEQIEALTQIKEENSYEYHKVLTDVYWNKYSILAIQKTIKHWIGYLNQNSSRGERDDDKKESSIAERMGGATMRN